MTIVAHATGNGQRSWANFKAMLQPVPSGEPIIVDTHVSCLFVHAHLLGSEQASKGMRWPGKVGMPGGNGQVLEL
jgi:hypothetical protein